MKSEKYEISLVVKGGHLPSYKLGVMREEGSEQASDAVAQPSGEVVQDHFWGVLCRVLPPSLKDEGTVY